MAKPRFRVELTGYLPMLGSVAPHLQAPELQVVIEGDRAFLESSTFGAMSSRDEVVGAAQRMVPLILGATRMAGLQYRSELLANRVYEETPDGPQNTTYAFAQAAAMIVEAGIPSISIGGQPPPAPPPIPVEIGLADERVALAMELFAREPSWSDLYKILDLIEDDVGGETGIKARGWATDEELGTFTGTANSYWAVGLNARHVVTSRKPMANPMSLDDAVSLIRRLLGGWLAGKP